jgi:hypothetical protein
MRTETIVPAILLTVAVCIGLASWRLTRRDFQKRFKTRPSLPPNEVLSQFSDHEVKALTGLLIKLENVLGVPSGKLRLTDRFGQELRSNPKIALATPETEALEDLQKCFPNEQLCILTVRDYCDAALRLNDSRDDAVDLSKRIFG